MGMMALMLLLIEIIVGPVGNPILTDNTVENVCGILITIFYIAIGWGLAQKKKWAYISAIIVMGLGALLLTLSFPEQKDAESIITSILAVGILILLVFARKDFSSPRKRTR